MIGHDIKHLISVDKIRWRLWLVSVTLTVENKTDGYDSEAVAAVIGWISLIEVTDGDKKVIHGE